jgi:hypothetical protein
MHSVYSLFSIIFQLYENSEGIPTADEVYTLFKEKYSQEEADEILGPNTDHDDMRKVGTFATSHVWRWVGGFPCT